MNENKTKTFDDGRDPVVTAISLIVIVVQSLLIIFGYLYRWNWLAYECAIILFGSSVWVVGYGVKAIVQANKLMMEEKEEENGQDKN